MGASLNEIKTRIASTKKTSQITRAMQMVSAAKLTKSESLSKDFQIYASKVRAIVTDIAASDIETGGATNGPAYLAMLNEREVKRTAYVVITSDKGLVGGYNSNVLKATLNMIQADHQSNDEFEIFAIGSTGADFFKARGMNVSYEMSGLADQPSFDDVRKMVNRMIQGYKDELFDALYVAYNHHINSLTHQFRVEKMLPISDLDHEEASSHRIPFIMEPSREAILEVLLPQFAESMIYGAIIDAKTAEHASGMTAMKTATDNAQTIISDLTIEYNRARQSAITQEITEIVAGAAALD
ncbi:MAG: F0F1 ATP synthase subunit gamma [Streptococcaceae bacterium]|jgi:F-type H+-transporting ATPase subunit gamma|nr:F0F1 ATP synthase subunit gamma [Streptococcaceae bacterium]